MIFRAFLLYVVIFPTLAQQNSASVGKITTCSKINITILWDVVPCSLLGNKILETNSAFIIMVEDADVIEKKKIIRHTEKGRLMPRISHPNYSVSLFQTNSSLTASPLPK